MTIGSDQRLHPTRKVWVTALLLTALVCIAPALSVLRTRIIGDGGDNYQFLGFQYIAHRLVSSGHLGFGHTSYWRYPAGFDLQRGADSMLFIAIGLVFYGITAEPVLVYNLSVLTLVLLNLLVSYLAFRTWFNRTISFIGGVMYGLSFYSLAKVGGHVNLISTAGFALFFAAIYRIYRDDGQLRDFILLAASVVYLLSSFHSFCSAPRSARNSSGSSGNEKCALSGHSLFRPL